MRWLARLQDVAQRQGFCVAPMIPARTGALTVSGWTVEPWLDGQPATVADLPWLRHGLARMHRATRGWPARPGLVMRLPVRLTGPPLVRTAAVHGDVHPGNVLRLASGGLALIDWEEAQVGDPRLDLGFPDTPLGRAAHALAEVRACWRAEPVRARQMARRLRLIWP